MTDFIKTSQVIQRFLDKHDIKIEVDEFAPCVARWTKESPPFYAVYTKKHIDTYFYKEMVCPFYGPGGEGNCLKALRAWVKKQGDVLYCLCQQDASHDCRWSIYVIDTMVEGDECCHLYETSGKTDGESLHDLLYKIATDSTGEKENEDDK